MQQSKETRRLKHKTILRHVSKDEDDTHQMHIFSKGQGVERQRIKHTDLRQARTREKTRKEKIIFSCQM